MFSEMNYMGHCWSPYFSLLHFLNNKFNNINVVFGVYAINNKHLIHKGKMAKLVQFYLYNS